MTIAEGKRVCTSATVGESGGTVPATTTVADPQDER